MNLMNLKEPFKSKASAAPGGKGPGEGPTSLQSSLRGAGAAPDGRGGQRNAAHAPAAQGLGEEWNVTRHLLLPALQAGCFPIKAQTLTPGHS